VEGHDKLLEVNNREVERPHATEGKLRTAQDVIRLKQPLSTDSPKSSPTAPAPRASTARSSNWNATTESPVARIPSSMVLGPPSEPPQVCRGCFVWVTLPWQAGPAWRSSAAVNAGATRLPDAYEAGRERLSEMSKQRRLDAGGTLRARHETATWGPAKGSHSHIKSFTCLDL
jgi:hypothetical protein